MKITIVLVVAYYAYGNLNYSEQYGHYKSIEECREQAAFQVTYHRSKHGVKLNEIMSMCYEVVNFR